MYIILLGNPDWSRIHQRQFDRMAGLDKYMENKKQRSEALTQSMKKMRLLSDQMRNTVNSAKSYRTPPSLLKVCFNLSGLVCWR